MSFAKAVYVLCAGISAACAATLIREYVRTHSRLLLWSSLSFGMFAISNLLTAADLLGLFAADLAIWRAATACVATLLLVTGLIWELE